MLEVSFGSPNDFENFNPFNNPNGSTLDADGVDTGSVYHQALGGTSGTIALDPRTLGVLPGVLHSMRVLATNGSAVIGEASDTSAFEMDGVSPPDGGTVFSHGLNVAGNDGLLMSVQLGCVTIGQNTTFANAPFALATGHTSGSAAMTFDQTSLQITNPAVTTSPDCDSQPTILANDTGLLYDRGARAFAAIHTVGSSPSLQYVPFPTGAIPNDISFEPGVPSFPDAQALLFVEGQDFVGGNSSASTAAFFGFRRLFTAVNQGTAFAFDLNTLATTPVMTIDDFASMTVPTVVGQAYDATTNIGYYAVADLYNGDVPATILAVNYAAQTHSVFSTGGEGLGNGYASGVQFLALDPATRKLLFVNDSSNDNRQLEFHVIDLNTKAVSFVTPPSYAGAANLDEVLADPVNGLYIVVERFRGIDSFDLTRPSGIDFFDEIGTLVKRVATPYTFFPFWLGAGPGTDLNYANGRKRRLFVPAPPNAAGIGEPQLMAIDY